MDEYKEFLGWADTHGFDFYCTSEMFYANSNKLSGWDDDSLTEFAIMMCRKSGLVIDDENIKDFIEYAK